MQVFSHGELTEMASVSLGVAMMETVSYLWICPSLDEQLHHRQIAILRGDVQGRYTPAVGWAAECGFSIDGCAVVDEPLGSFDSIAGRRPN